MREVDWSATALGPVDVWPQSLKTSVSTLLECAFPVIVYWGPELVLLYNDEYCPMLGTKHPWALGRPGLEVWAEIRDVIEPMLSQVLQRGEPTRARDLLLHINRGGYPEEAYFSFSFSPIHAEGGAVGGVFCPVIETTEKVIAERRLRTLRDLAARCKGADREDVLWTAVSDVLAANPHDVPFALVYGIDDRITTATLSRTIGIEPGTPASPEVITIDAQPEGVWMAADVARHGRTLTVTGLGERFNGLPGGAWKTSPQTAMVMPVLLPGQEHPRAILIAAASPMRALDADYRTFFNLIATQIASGLADAQAREEERRRAASLAELDRAKTAFFSNVSHEFRTPLTLMLGPLEDLLSGAAGELGADVRQAIDITHRNSLRLLKLVNTLLDFSRLEAGRIDANYEPTDLAAVTAELSSTFRSAAEKAGLRLLVDCPPLPEPVYVDRDMWEKIVLNLLSNAFKFTLEGEIAVRLDWRGDHVELVVRDTGAGISEADLPRLFRRFHRIKHTRARTHEGTGIGLALVQELSHLHGGSVSVASTLDVGTTFTVSIRTGAAHLPADRVAAGRQLASTGIGANPYVEEALRWTGAGNGAPLDNLDTPPVPGAPDGETPRARVLVADDNADMREYLQRLLSSRYDVETVGDGAAALDSILRKLPDLVLSDVMMPRLDGFGLLAAIRADARTRSVPVMLLSARAGEEARIEGLQAGADGYMFKPFNSRELLARIASHLELARLRKEDDRRKDEFLALLAHELRNPLAPIRTGLELIRVAGDQPATVKRVRSMMERQVGHMVRLIDDLLDVSRITSGKIVLKRVPTSLVELVQNAVDAQRAALAEAGLKLTVGLPERHCVADVDPTRFVQVLSNVLHNAVKFTPAPGEIKLTARVRVRDQGTEELEIRVSDTGIGIASDMLPRVFELFAQAEHPTERQNSGLGLGLALARRLIEMHDGTIDARSDGPGRGSTFVITLPLPQIAARPASHVRAADHRTNRRVLIVDDNEDAANTMAMLVQELGGAASTARDALSGIDKIASFKPDIVFLDIGMPGVDGYEACRRIRQSSARCDMVLVALTGWGHPQDRQHALEVGFDAHLTKPVDPATLEELLSPFKHQ